MHAQSCCFAPKTRIVFDTVVVVVAVAQLLIYIPKPNKTHSPAWHVVQYK